jgi:polyferredoxin
MVAHFIHWKIARTTLTPLEPSEIMQTFSQGLVNAGAILFAIATLSTLVFGRFFCGWGCHIVALQDLCSWALGKMGIAPRPFRSRLLDVLPSTPPRPHADFSPQSTHLHDLATDPHA